MKDTRLIGLANRQLGHGNPEPSREDNSRACVENMGSVSAVKADSEMFQSSMRKLEKDDIVASLLITQLITGTTAGDTLSKIGAFRSNLGLKTPLIRGKLNPFGHANPELADGFLSHRASVEAIYGAPLWGEERVHSSMKIEGKVYPKCRTDSCGLRSSDRDPAKIPGLVPVAIG